MNRKIGWNSGVLDEIELVYEKAEANEATGKLLEQLEDLALSEIRENSSLLNTAKFDVLTPEIIDGMSSDEKEAVIAAMGQAGLLEIRADAPNAKIICKLSPCIRKLTGCTFFNLLNRLEKLDGSWNVLMVPGKTTLELQVPLGGRKGLLQWELLVMTLYPWISFRETASDLAAADLIREGSAAARAAPAPEKKPVLPVSSTPEPETPQEPEKKSFWQRLFSRSGKKADAPAAKGSAGTVPGKGQENRNKATVPDVPAKQTKDSAAPVSDAFRKLMTSQLTALWLETKEEKYKTEFFRRIAMCGVTDETARKWFEFETEILKRCPRPEMLSEDFITRPMFSLTARVLPRDIAYYADHFDYPLSYVVKLSDEAEWHFWNSHERDLPEGVWEEIWNLSDKNGKLFLPLAQHMTDKLGWTVQAVNKYSYNEQGMLDLLRWGKKSTRAAMVPWGMKVR